MIKPLIKVIRLAVTRGVTNRHDIFNYFIRSIEFLCLSRFLSRADMRLDSTYFKNKIEFYFLHFFYFNYPFFLFGNFSFQVDYTTNL
jgi:hypothetical protein